MKELWTLKCKKLVTDYDLNIKYESEDVLKENSNHRLLSDYVNVLFDEG